MLSEASARSRQAKGKVEKLRFLSNWYNGDVTVSDVIPTLRKYAKDHPYDGPAWRFTENPKEEQWVGSSWASSRRGMKKFLARLEELGDVTAGGAEISADRVIGLDLSGMAKEVLVDLKSPSGDLFIDWVGKPSEYWERMSKSQYQSAVNQFNLLRQQVSDIASVDEVVALRPVKDFVVSKRKK